MRDILDKLSILIESTGLAGRKPGDIFKSQDGNTISFNQIEFYPNEGGRLEKIELDSLLKNLQDVRWQNNRTAKSGGIVIATFDTEKGTVRYGFFKDNIKPNKTDNYIPNQVNNYRYGGKAAEKVQSGLTPQDLLSKRDNLTSDQIIAQLIQKLGKNNILVQVAIKINNGEELPISFPSPPDASFTGFRDYFCEILQPIALQKGLYTGNAGEAAETFLDGSFIDTLISFDAAKNAGLSDSILTNSEGKFIKISTKGGKGAEASAKNLIDAVNELSNKPAGNKLLKKYKESIDLIKEIQQQGQRNAPLYLGIKYNIISEKEAGQIQKLRNTKPINLKDIKKIGLSKNLEKLAIGRETDDPENVNLFYHLIASVAHLAAKKVNNETDFSQAAAEILNNGALVQVYTKAKQSEKEWVLENFDTVYPGKSIKGVYLSAGKNYFSTQIKGNFTFKIDRGAGKPPKEDNEEPTTKSIKPTVDLAKAAKDITRGLREPTNVKPKSSAGIGRAKRK